MTTPNRSPPSGPFYSSTRPGAPLTPTLNTHGHTQPTPLRGRDGPESANPDAAPPAPPHTALPTISPSLRPHPGPWPLPVSSSSGSPPGPRAQFRALRPPPPHARTHHQVTRLRTPKLYPPPHRLLSPSTAAPAAAAATPLTLHNSQALALADQHHPPSNSPVSTPPHPAPPPLQLPGSPRFPALSPLNCPPCTGLSTADNTQTPSSPHNYLPTPPTITGPSPAATTRSSTATNSPTPANYRAPHSVLSYILPPQQLSGFQTPPASQPQGPNVLEALSAPNPPSSGAPAPIPHPPQHIHDV